MPRLPRCSDLSASACQLVQLLCQSSLRLLFHSGQMLLPNAEHGYGWGCRA